MAPTPLRCAAEQICSVFGPLGEIIKMPPCCWLLVWHFAGDFKGAKELVLLILSGNVIVSVAPEAFRDLHQFAFKPEEFNPKDTNSMPWRNAFGVGASCP